jgi:hypothetical protein
MFTQNTLTRTRTVHRLLYAVRKDNKAGVSLNPMSETYVVLFLYDNCLECDCLPAVQLTVPLLQLYTCCTTFHHVTLFKGLVTREAVFV